MTDDHIRGNRTMDTLAGFRSQIRACKFPAAGQSPRTFVPEGSLTELFSPANVRSILSDSCFQVPSHKLEGTVEIILSEGRKILAILIDLGLEKCLRSLIENDCLDSRLPLSESDLKHIPPGDSEEIVRRQWEYIAYTFRKGNYLRRVQAERIMPYLQQTKIGGGGYSIVYEVVIHPAHQNILSSTLLAGVCIVRKEIRVVNAGSSNDDEAELLFLLGSLRHRNIVELLASYIQGGIANLIFPRADSDLHKFLLSPGRPSKFQDDATFFKSLQGLSSGLAYLHNFRHRPDSSDDPMEPSLHGYHHDIKPRNILVRGTDFVLADFGLSRLKTNRESTQTDWKDSTYEYGAPECRDPNTFRPLKVGRAFDIWSLACIFSEVMVYMESGPGGIESFRECRLVDNVHGKTRCFHDNHALAFPVDCYIRDIEKNSTSAAIRSLALLIRSMLAAEPEARPKAKDVEDKMANVTLEAFVLDLLRTLKESYDFLGGSGDANIFGTRIILERIRLEGWAAVLGLLSIQGLRRPQDKHTLSIFPEACDILGTVIKELKCRPGFEDIRSDQDFVVSALHQTNNSICGLLTDTLRTSVDSTFAILVTRTKSLQSLKLIEEATKGNLGRSEDITAISAIKYMSILLQQTTSESVSGKRIESILVEEDPVPCDTEISPQAYWYSYGYRKNERTKVLVEYKAFDSQWTRDAKSTTFEELGGKVFREIQLLINMLQHEPKPTGFRVLKCLGAFPDIPSCRFGIVYNYPHEHTIPIRLHSLLKRQRAQIAVPGLSERVALATLLATSVQAFHVSGWLHKNINSYNVLFFCNSLDPLVSLKFDQPYIVGFSHSRQDSPDSHTEGLSNTSLKDYQHPLYQTGATRFEKHFDIYSLGLLLLEIGLWGSMGDISRMYKELSPLALKEKYMRCCDSLGGMGQKYQKVTRLCLEADQWLSKHHETISLKFQEEVVETLQSCSI